MRITLRLYRQHDLDLVALYRHKGFCFSKAVKQMIVAYANGSEYTPPQIDPGDISSGLVATSVTYHITLDENDPEEAAAIDLLKDIKYGYRNSFVKALVRTYMGVLPLHAYSRSNSMSVSKNDYRQKLKAQPVAPAPVPVPAPKRPAQVNDTTENTPADHHTEEPDTPEISETPETSDTSTEQISSAEYHTEKPNAPEGTDSQEVDADLFSQLINLSH